MKDYRKIEYKAYCIQWLGLPIEIRIETEPLSFEDWCKKCKEVNNE